MGSVKKVYVYECDTCKRTVERLNDGKHPDPIRCVITKKCRGKLSLFKTRDGGSPRLTPPVVGLDDWFARSKVPDQAVKEPNIAPANIFSFAGDGGLTVLAVQRKTVSGLFEYYVIDSLGADFTLEAVPMTNISPVGGTVSMVCFELTPSTLTYRHYMFSFSGGVARVEGQDDTPEGSLLRFSSTSVLKVYANGIELAPTAYDRTTDDVIIMTPELTDSLVIIDVYVYKDLTTDFDEANAIRLPFTPLGRTNSTDLALRNAGSWGNIIAARGLDGPDHLSGVVRYPTYCVDLTELDRSKSYGVARFEATTADGLTTKTLDPATLYILMAQPPYAFNDKNINRTVRGDTLTGGAAMTFVVSDRTGASELSVPENAVTQTYQPIIVTRRLTSAELTNPAAQETTPLRKIVSTPKKYIIGPS